jgi:mono/diheme cytochrome c family protein
MRNIPETVHEYNIPRLNVWFVVSSFLLLLCVGWMLWDDYMREWKPYQRQAKVFEAQKLELDRIAAETKMEQAGYSTVTNSLAQAEIIWKQQEPERLKLQEKVEKLKATIEVKKIAFAAEKDRLGQSKSEYDEAVEFKKSTKEIDEHKHKLRAQEKIVRDLEADLKIRDEEFAVENAKLTKYTEDKTKYEKEKGRLETEKRLVEKRLGYINIKKTNTLAHLLDAPLVEFAQPTVKVEQVIAEDQTYNLNFVDVSRIDRCITCHTFTDKKDPDDDAAFKFANLPQPWKSHPRLDLFLSPDSPHPVERFGCSVCHAGWDRGTKFINAAHTPSFHSVKQDYVKMPLVEGDPRWVPSATVEKWKPGMISKVQNYQKLMEEKRTLSEARYKNPTKQAEVRAAVEKSRSELQAEFGMDAKALSQFQFASLTQEEAWHQASPSWHHMHHKEDPMRPREFTESSCLKCHQQVTEIPTRKDPKDPSAEMVTGEKVNMGLRLIEQAGCYACHKMQALETTVKYKVPEGAKIKKLQKNPKGEMVEQDFILPKDSLDSIAHAKSADPKAILAYNGLSSADDIKGGQELDIPVRIPARYPGPTLLKIASKTTPEWTLKWLEDPKAFRPNTFMPRFWNLDNNRDSTHFEGTLTDPSGKPIAVNWGDRNAVERAAIVQYIFGQSETQKYPTPPSGDTARGEKLVSTVGCMACHVVDQKLSDLPLHDQRYRSQGPMLTGAGSKYDAGWLYSWLKDPFQYHKGTRMPNLRLSDQEAADITAYLMTSRNQEFDQRPIPKLKPEVMKDAVLDYLQAELKIEDAKKIAATSNVNDQDFQKNFHELGSRLVQRYGCMDCHRIKDMENAKPISIELSDWAGKSASKLDFGFVELPHDNYSFLHQKLVAPRSFDRVDTKRPQELLRMPQYNFTEEQAELIMTAIMGMTGEKPNAKAKKNLDENEWQIENGRHLIKELNCLGCHVNEGSKGGAIRRVIGEDSVMFYPPSLDGVGTKARTDWLHAFLKNPGKHPYRDWMQARMPTYNFSDDQLNTLTRYFALRDKQPYPFESHTEEHVATKESIEIGRKLVEEKKCLQCHAIRPMEQALAAGNPAIKYPLVKSKLRRKGMIEWIRNPHDVSRPNPVTPDTEGGRMLPFGDPVPGILDGDTEKQLGAIADYILSLGSSEASTSKTK